MKPHLQTPQTVLLMPQLPSLLVMLQLASSILEVARVWAVCSSFLEKLDLTSVLIIGEDFRRSSLLQLTGIAFENRCLIMLRSIPRRLSSDVLLAAEPEARRASPTLAVIHAQGFRCLEIGFVLSKATQVSAHFTVHHSKHVCVVQTSEESCTLGTRRASHDPAFVYASSMPALKQSRPHR